MSHFSSFLAFPADAKAMRSFITGLGVKGLVQDLLVRGRAGAQTSGSEGTLSLALPTSAIHHPASGTLSKISKALPATEKNKCMNINLN